MYKNNNNCDGKEETEHILTQQDSEDHRVSISTVTNDQCTNQTHEDGATNEPLYAPSKVTDITTFGSSNVHMYSAKTDAENETDLMSTVRQVSEFEIEELPSFMTHRNAIITFLCVTKGVTPLF